MTLRMLRGLGFLACAGALAGCWSFRSGDPARLSSPVVTSLPADAWPARDMDAMVRLRDATPTHLYVGKVYEVRAAQRRHDGVESPSALRAGTLLLPTLPLTHNAIHGEGLLRLVGVPPLSAGVRWVHEFTEKERDRNGFVPTGWFLTSRALNDPRVQIELDRVRAMRAGLDRVRAVNPAEARSLEALQALDDALVRWGLAIKLPDPLETPPRGLILHMHSLLPNRFEPAVLDEFRSRGWAVVTLFTSTGVTPPYSEEQIVELGRVRERLLCAVEEWFDDKCVEAEKTSPCLTGRSESSVRRFANDIIRRSQRDVERLTDKASYQVRSECDIEQTAHRIAREADEALASNAYAVEGVLDYIRKHRPDIDPRASGTPLVVVGFSAGAIAAPAAVVRVRDEVDAVVLVGGGANLLHIAQHSSLTDGGLRLRRGAGRVPASWKREMEAEYLRVSRLDPYHTAPLLAGLPVLHVHASWDAIVPASCGELLNERLGRPDLLSLSGGHTALFLLMPAQSSRLADWVERAVSRDPAASRDELPDPTHRAGGSCVKEEAARGGDIGAHAHTREFNHQHT